MAELHEYPSQQTPLTQLPYCGTQELAVVVVGVVVDELVVDELVFDVVVFVVGVVDVLDEELVEGDVVPCTHCE